MSTPAIILLLLALLCIFAPFVRGREKNDPLLDLDRVLRAIIAVENWDGHSIGEEGELGPLQTRPAVWLMHSDRPLNWANGTHPVQKAEQMRVGREIVEWIDRRLPGLHLPRNVRSIALVYSTGYGNVKIGNVSRAKKDYAQRVANMYQAIAARAPSAKPVFQP